MAGIAKSATTPAHMITLPVRSHCPNQASTVGLINRFTVPSATSPGRRPNLFSRQAAGAARPNYPCHVPEPYGAKERPCRVSKPDRKTVVPNCSAFGIYGKSPSDSSPLQGSKSPSNAPPNPRHDKESEATQHTQPDHRPGRHQSSNQPWVPVRSQ